MAAKGKKRAEEEEEDDDVDDDMDVDEDDDDNEDDDDDDEEELDEVLGLPAELSSKLSVREKRDLRAFKESHTVVEWEQEILRRSEKLNRQIDMERLQRMAKGTAESSSSAPAGKRGKAAPKVGAHGLGWNGRRLLTEGAMLWWSSTFPLSSPLAGQGGSEGRREEAQGDRR